MRTRLLAGLMGLAMTLGASALVPRMAAAADHPLAPATDGPPAIRR